MYPVIQPVESRRQDEFWSWFAPDNDVLLQPWPPSSPVAGLLDGCALTEKVNYEEATWRRRRENREDLEPPYSS